MLTTGQIASPTYSKDYKDYCFFIWWKNGRPTFTNLMLHIEKFQDRMKPDDNTLRRWAETDGWVERADDMDAEVLEALKAQYVSEKAQMLARHAELGRELQEMGIEYLRKTPIDSQGGALRAIQLGIQTEGEAAQIEKMMKDVAKMDDPQVVSNLRSLLDKAKLKKGEDDWSEPES